MPHPTSGGQEVRIDEAAIAAFRRRLRGPLLQPGDDGYDAVRRVWNAMIDRRHELLVSVRGGGHNVAGTAVCDGGLMIDLSLMKDIRVDSAGRTARAEPGLTWGEFDRETQAFGLATTGGICSETGIAGVTLGGGFGWLMRKCGLALVLQRRFCGRLGWDGGGERPSGREP